MMCLPLFPHVYCLSSDPRAGTSIRVWTPTYVNTWARFVPGFDDVLASTVYRERESEFDEEEARPEPQVSEPADVFGVDLEWIFSSDELFYLPLDVLHLHQHGPRCLARQEVRPPGASTGLPPAINESRGDLPNQETNMP